MSLLSLRSAVGARVGVLGVVGLFVVPALGDKDRWWELPLVR